MLHKNVIDCKGFRSLSANELEVVSGGQWQGWAIGIGEAVLGGLAGGAAEGVAGEAANNYFNPEESEDDAAAEMAISSQFDPTNDDNIPLQFTDADTGNVTRGYMSNGIMYWDRDGNGAMDVKVILDGSGQVWYDDGAGYGWRMWPGTETWGDDLTSTNEIANLGY